MGTFSPKPSFLARNRHNDNPNLGLNCFIGNMCIYHCLFFCGVPCFQSNSCRWSASSSGSILWVCFVGFCCAVVVPVIAGNSFYGRETADSVLKVVLLYIITGLVPKIIQFYDSQSSNEGGTPVQNVPTTQNSSASTASASGSTCYREADNDLELHEIETQGEERSRLLMNTSR